MQSEENPILQRNKFRLNECAYTKHDVYSKSCACITCDKTSFNIISISGTLICHAPRNKWV